MENQALWLDIAVGVVLLASLLIGAKRGLVRSLVGIAMLALALWGASWCTDQLTPPIMERIEPLIEERVDQEIEENTDLNRLPGFLNDLVEGISDSAISWLTKEIQDIIAPVVETAVFVIVFLALRLVLGLLGNLLKLSTNLPVIHTCNALGGAVLGLISGVVILLLAVYAGQQFGWISPETLENSHVAHYFVLKNADKMIGSL